MKIRDILNWAKFLITVPKCVGCGEALDYGDRALCNNCLSEFAQTRTRSCSVCAKDLPECKCPNSELFKSGVRVLVKRGRYIAKDKESPLNKLIFSLKKDHRADVIGFAASELLASLKPYVKSLGEDSRVIFTFVPRRGKTRVKYGYDHSALVAKYLARELNCEYAPMFRSLAKKNQKSTVGMERRRNAVFKLKRIDHSLLKGSYIIIVDDIVTTGSSMAACARLIRGARPKRIVGCTLGIAYKDESIPRFH